MRGLPCAGAPRRAAFGRPFISAAHHGCGSSSSLTKAEDIVGIRANGPCQPLPPMVSGVISKCSALARKASTISFSVRCRHAKWRSRLWAWSTVSSSCGTVRSKISSCSVISVDPPHLLAEAFDDRHFSPLPAFVSRWAILTCRRRKTHGWIPKLRTPRARL